MSAERSPAPSVTRAHAGWPVWLAWLVLAAASVAGVLMAEGLVPARVAASLAFVLAALKIRIVFSQYMELGWHHRPLGPLLDAWLVAITAILLLTYWLT